MSALHTHWQNAGGIISVLHTHWRNAGGTMTRPLAYRPSQKTWK